MWMWYLEGWRWRWTDGRECCPDWCWCRSPAGCPCRKANNTRTNKSPAFKIKDAAGEDTYWPAAPRRLPRLACPAPPAPHRFVLPRSPPSRSAPEPPALPPPSATHGRPCLAPTSLDVVAPAPAYIRALIKTRLHLSRPGLLTVIAQYLQVKFVV